MTSATSTSPTTPSPEGSHIPITLPSLAQVAYEAYGDRPGPHGPWKTFDGRDMPRWDALSGPTGALTRERWEAGVEAALAERVRRELPADWIERQRRMLNRLRGYQSFVAVPGTQPGTVVLQATRTEATATVTVGLLEWADRRWRGDGATRVAWAVLGGDAMAATAAEIDEEHGRESEQVDPFLAGLSEIGSAVRDLAEASKASHSGELDALILLVTAQLHARVKRLAQPDNEPAKS